MHVSKFLLKALKEKFAEPIRTFNPPSFLKIYNLGWKIPLVLASPQKTLQKLSPGQVINSSIRVGSVIPEERSNIARDLPPFFWVGGRIGCHRNYSQPEIQCQDRQILFLFQSGFVRSQFRFPEYRYNSFFSNTSPLHNETNALIVIADGLQSRILFIIIRLTERIAIGICMISISKIPKIVVLLSF